MKRHVCLFIYFASHARRQRHARLVFLILRRSLTQFRLRRRGGLSGSVREERFEIRGFEWLNVFL